MLLLLLLLLLLLRRRRRRRWRRLLLLLLLLIAIECRRRQCQITQRCGRSCGKGDLTGTTAAMQSRN
jgi:hypothetical protein